MFVFNLQRNLTSAKHPAFWGLPTSSVDWCEVNYEVTEYVAEYYNTLSSFAMAAVGLLGIVMHPWAERRFHVAFLATVAVGLGSVAFHGTLWKFSQALDEVPMLYSALAFAYIGLCERIDFSASGRRMLAAGLALHAVFTTLLVTLSEGPYQFLLFHLSFGTAQTFALAQAIMVYRDRRARLARSAAAQAPLVCDGGEMGHGDTAGDIAGGGKMARELGRAAAGPHARHRTRAAGAHGGDSDGDSDGGRIVHGGGRDRGAAASAGDGHGGRDAAVWAFERGLAAYAGAFACWLADMLLCEALNPAYAGAVLPANPQLHAWWHVLVSAGLYNMALLTIAARADALRGPGAARLGFWLRVLPYGAHKTVK
ncbi:hypothetical protein HK105_200322 [Polyrhizophydium stewartii]|uniref:Ceramidase n=1 Tax=Polyrhizophydium stewartii TaxID=2732419 RepID=A0ABR4NL35_9FUNG